MCIGLKYKLSSLFITTCFFIKEENSMIRKKVFLLLAALFMTSLLTVCDYDSSDTGSSPLLLSTENQENNYDFLSAVSATAQSALPNIRELMPGEGVHGTPYGAVPTTLVYEDAAVVDLEGAGYVEREFILSGKATSYKQSGYWGINGKWKVSVSKSNVPYTPRIPVRNPPHLA